MDRATALTKPLTTQVGIMGMTVDPTGGFRDQNSEARIIQEANSDPTVSVVQSQLSRMGLTQSTGVAHTIWYRVYSNRLVRYKGSVQAAPGIAKFTRIQKHPNSSPYHHLRVGICRMRNLV